MNFDGPWNHQILYFYEYVFESWQELNVRRCKRLRMAKKNLGLYAQKMAKWIDEWNEMISKFDASVFESGNLGDEAKESSIII